MMDFLIAEHSNVSACDAWNTFVASYARSRSIGTTTAESCFKYVHTVAGKLNRFDCATVKCKLIISIDTLQLVRYENWSGSDRD